MRPKRRGSTPRPALFWILVILGLIIFHIAAVQQTFSFVSAPIALASLIWLTAGKAWPALLGLATVGEFFSTLPAGVFSLAILVVVLGLRVGKVRHREFSLKLFAWVGGAVFASLLAMHGGEQAVLRFAPDIYSVSLWRSLPISRLLFTSLGTTIAVLVATGIWRELFPQPQRGVQSATYAR